MDSSIHTAPGLLEDLNFQVMSMRQSQFQIESNQMNQTIKINKLKDHFTKLKEKIDVTF